MDGTDMEDWPGVLGGAKTCSEAAGEATQDQDYRGNNNNSSASWSEKNIQQKGGGNMDNPSPPFSSPLSSSSSLNECVQSSSVWGSPTASQVEAGQGSAAFHSSKVSHLLSGPQESLVCGSISSAPGANFNPSSNPSAWPALPQSGTTTTTTASDGLSLHSSVISASSFSASTQLITTHSLSSVNQAGAHQQHTETAVGARSGEQQQAADLATESNSGEGVVGVGPNKESGKEKETLVVKREESANVSGSLSSSSTAASSWRAMPPVSLDLGAEGWGGAPGQEGKTWSFGSKGDGEAWGKDGGSNTQVVSQGAGEGCSSVVEWGSTVGGSGSSHSAIGRGRGGGGSSGSSGGSGDSVLPESASPKFATMTKAWDNQKGVESGDGEWGVGGGPGASTEVGLLPLSRGGSLAGSSGEASGGEPNVDRVSCGRQLSHQTNAEVALQSMLSRSDLDPRVLSNTGWGQTQIRQNVAWDFNTTTVVGNRNEKSTSFPSANLNTSTSRGPGYPSNTTNPPTASSSVREVWSRGGRTPDEEVETKPRRADGGWGETPAEGKRWGTEEHWKDNRAKGKWGEFGEQGTGWEDDIKDKGTGGWKGTGRGEAGGWGGEWGQRDSVPGGVSISEEGSSYTGEGGSQRGGWGGESPQWDNAKPHTTTAAPIPNSQVAPLKAPNQQHQSQGQQAPGGPTQGGWSSRASTGGGAPPSKNQNQSSGWTSGPIPQIPGDGGDSMEPSGWEEPSPQSISRKMEIDDGTAAWGDPSCYNSKNVNLWDKNAAPGQSHSQQPPPVSIQQQPPRRQQGQQHSGKHIYMVY